MVAYGLSRSVGLPGEGGEEIGNWEEALGLASLMIEGSGVPSQTSSPMRSAKAAR